MGVNYSVKVRKKDNIERVIKRFIKKCKKLGIINEVRDRKEFKSKSERKRIAKRKAARKNNKN